MSSVPRLRAALRTPVGVLAVIGLVALIFFAISGPIIWGHAADTPNTAALQEGPSHAHLLGTDELGRDILARVLAATRLSLTLAILATLVGGVVGVIFGAIPAVAGRRAGRIASGLINLLLAFPGLLLAIVIAIVAGVGERGAVLAIGLAAVPGFARLTETLAASIAGTDFVQAARVLGVPRRRLLLRHVLPNIAEPLLLNITLSIGGALLAFASLSFLGLGVQPPGFDWGEMLNDSLNRIYVTPIVALAPGIAVVLAALVFSMLGEVAARVVSTRPARAPRTRAAASKPTTATAGPAVSTDAKRAPVLEVDRLNVSFPFGGGEITPVRDVSFAVDAGEIVGVVGESGSGKTLTALAVAGLVDLPGTVKAARLNFLGREVRTARGKLARHVLGTELAMVFQNPGAALNPALRVGRQLTEVAEVHQRLSRRNAKERAVDKLRQVAMPAATERMRQYPHELSGGMAQRAVIAMGLMGDPKLLIADEPTTALDMTVQQQILDLLKRVNKTTGAGAIVISHDIAVVAGLCHRVMVMYAGRVVEELPVASLGEDAAHPYTRALLAAIPHLGADRQQRLATIPGRPPSPHEVGEGCSFAPRCARADESCLKERPDLATITDGHRVACWHPQTAEHKVASAVGVLS